MCKFCDEIYTGDLGEFLVADNIPFSFGNWKVKGLDAPSVDVFIEERDARKDMPCITIHIMSQYQDDIYKRQIPILFCPKCGRDLRKESVYK